MTALRYFGRNSDSSNAGTHIVMDKGGVDDVYGSAKVDAAYVNTALQFATTSLATVSYVTGQDNLRAKTADVLAADTAHVPLTDLAGVSGGVVPVSPNSITVPDNRVPATIKVSRKPKRRSRNGATGLAAMEPSAVARVIRPDWAADRPKPSCIISGNR